MTLVHRPTRLPQAGPGEPTLSPVRCDSVDTGRSCSPCKLGVVRVWEPADDRTVGRELYGLAQFVGGKTAIPFRTAAELPALLQAPHNAVDRVVRGTREWHAPATGSRRGGAGSPGMVGVDTAERGRLDTDFVHSPGVVAMRAPGLTVAARGHERRNHTQVRGLVPAVALQDPQAVANRGVVTADRVRDLGQLAEGVVREHPWTVGR